MTLLVTLAILALASQLLLTLVVLMRDTNALQNRAFAALSVALAFWAALTFAFDVFPDVAQDIFTVRATMLFVVLQNCFFPLFTYSLLRNRVVYSKKLIAYTVLSVVTAALMLLTPAMFSALTTNKAGAVYPVAQPGMVLFVIHAVISITIGFRFLIRKFRQTTGSSHLQLMYILFGSVVLWGIVPITNFALSISLQSTFYAKYTPIFTLTFSSLIVFAIIRHRLFDIKRAILSAVAYFLAIATVVVVYGISFLSGISQTFGFGVLPIDRLLLLFGFATLIGLGIPPLVRFFDNITQKLFFRKTYDSQRAIDQLTGIFVRTTTLKELLGQSAETLQKVLGVDAVTVSLARRGGAGQRIAFSTLQTRSERPQPILTQAYLLDSKDKVVVADMLEDSEQGIGGEMRAMNIGAVGELHSPTGVVGYLILGYKKNGAHYNLQDFEFIDIIIDEFAIAIQSMLRYQEIAEFNTELQKRIEEATAELRAKNAKLKKLDEAKDEFISMASHQLRTPLTSVKGYLSMVLDGDAGKLSPDQRKILEQAFGSSQRMVYLIGDFLNVSRIQTGKFEIEYSPVNLANVVSQEINQLVETAKTKRIILTYDVPENFPTISADENKLRQVMMNFMDNAIYYSPADTTIKVQLYKDADSVVFKVTDQGIGVPKSDQPKLFTKFFRAPNAKQQRPDGTGIGLYMAKKVIVGHHGTVIFETKEGKGSTFGFKLPMKDIK